MFSLLDAEDVLAIDPLEPEAGDEHGGPRPGVLAVVRIGLQSDEDTISWAAALQTEHGCQLTVIATWLPRWWQGVALAACPELMAGFQLERVTGEQYLAGWCADQRADLLLANRLMPLAAVVERELAAKPYGYVVVGRGAVPRRTLARWRARDCCLSVICPA
jgi:hypothetical protein